MTRPADGGSPSSSCLEQGEQELPKIQILGLPVADLTRAEVVAWLVHTAQEGHRATTAFAVHIGGISVAVDAAFREAMGAADLVYADGVSAVLLARLGGATRIERSPTTDVGWDLLRGFRRAAGRPARLAVVGGEGGLAERALGVIEGEGLAARGFAAHGFHDDWDEVLGRLADNRPDVILVGLGAPREMLWVQQHLDRLPPSLVLTCGGWLNFVVGDEPRAPAWLRRLGLEWVSRWRNQPRLTGRYLRGLYSFPVLAAKVLSERRRSR